MASNNERQLRRHGLINPHRAFHAAIDVAVPGRHTKFRGY
jgi:hypothetical protein